MYWLYVSEIIWFMTQNILSIKTNSVEVKSHMKLRLVEHFTERKKKKKHDHKIQENLT